MEEDPAEEPTVIVPQLNTEGAFNCCATNLAIISAAVITIRSFVLSTTWYDPSSDRVLIVFAVLLIVK